MYLAMKASASAPPAGGSKLPRDVSGQEFLGQDGKYPPVLQVPLRRVVRAMTLLL